MSIKKLFESANSGRNYLSDTDQKEAFKDVESERNLEQLSEKQSNFVPQIDYTKPSRFAKYGSAYYYYKGALERITDYYPYDGSDAEINGFYNKLLDVEKYIFNNTYPRTHGYVTLAESTGTGGAEIAASGSGGADAYIVPTTKEYITLKGGPNAINPSGSLVGASNNPYSDKFQYSNVYDTDIYATEGLPSDYGKGTRQSNLLSNFDTGVTIEFWLKKPTFGAYKETVFDLWTSGSQSGSADYGRITIELTGAAGTSPFLLTAQSGSPGTGIFQQSIGSSNITTSTLSTWTHVALVMHNTGSDFVSKLYINGGLDDTNITTSTTVNQLKQRGLFGRIGALMTAPSGSAKAQGSNPGSVPSSYDGASKLSASMDEFRFWKTARTAREIGRNWFTQVRGGSNTDISNTTLGVYYKFNEGITGVSAVDSSILDYSGRISNGAWTGYGTNSRSTQSAILEASASVAEYKDPIIYSAHPAVTALKTGLLESGSYHDSQNSGLFLNYAPSWVIEEHEKLDNKNLELIAHIAGTYFDRLYLMSQQMPKLHGINYTSASAEPVPFAQHLPQSLGLHTPEIFIDSTVVEKFLNRNDNSVFEDDLNDTKNLIYLNLYNNLANIFKSKGTEKALRNVLRCFHIDEKLVKINTYGKNTTFPLSNNYEQVIDKRSYANFNKKENRSAVIYQSIEGMALLDDYNATTDYSSSQGFISGTVTTNYEQNYGATIEAQVMFPHWARSYADDPRDYTTVSLFGGATPYSSSVTGLSGTFLGPNHPNYTNFQVYAIKTDNNSKDVYFMLTSSALVSGGERLVPTLTSSIFQNVYDNDIWNLSVRVEPKLDVNHTQVSGATITQYNVIFSGENITLGAIENKFEISSSVNAIPAADSGASGSMSDFLIRPKRLYVGAQRTNMTGSLVHKSDVLVGSLKYWAKSLKNGSLNQHAQDADNYGISGSYKNVSPLDSNNTGDILNLNTLALNWAFNQVTGSNATGNFFVKDISSGSVDLKSEYGIMGQIAGYKHPGYGYGFQANSSDVVAKRQTNSFKFIEPERVTSADAIQILSEDDKVFGVTEVIPSYVYTVEKSMYRAISEEMLDMLAGVVDFNNTIGAPVNRYRERYKSLEKLREIFFRRVSQTSQVEKFVEYYKWFDDAISLIMAQLVPASSDFVPDTYNTIESHVLERNKYQTRYPGLENVPTDPEGAVEGVGAFGSAYKDISTTLPGSPRPTDDHTEYWFRRAERGSIELTSGDAAVDSNRNTFRDVVNTAPRLSRTPLRRVKSDGTGGTYVRDSFKERTFQQTYQFKAFEFNETLIHGGINFDQSKNIHFTYSALYPFGPINTSGGRFVPLNVMLGLTSDLVSIKDFVEDREIRGKVKRVFKVQHGREWEDGQGYSNVKSTIAFPFNIMSSSVNSGYNKDVVDRVGANVEITNLHSDMYGPAMEIPMQGPFTEKYVGGHQSRHVPYNSGATDTYITRPEAWKLLLGQCADQGVGAIGMSSVTYPYPDIAAPPSSAYGRVDFAGNVSSEDSITISDGDTSIKFEVPFTNTKSALFGPFQGSKTRITVGGNWSGSLDSSNAVSPIYCKDGDPGNYGCSGTPDFYNHHQQTWSAWVSQSAADGGNVFQTGTPHGEVTFMARSNKKLRLTQYWWNAGTDSGVSSYWETVECLTPGKWHHVAVTFNAALSASQTASFFVDGEQIELGSSPSNLPTYAGSRLFLDRYADGTWGSAGSTSGYTCGPLSNLPCNSKRIYATIGGTTNAGTSWTGSIDELSLWDVSMSVDQISELYNTGSTLNLFKHSVYTSRAANLHSWWRLGDNEYDALDGSGVYGSGNRIKDIAKSGSKYGFPGAAVSAFDTNVVTASSAAGGTTVTWTLGGNTTLSAENLISAINDQSFNITARGPDGDAETITIANTKYGIAGSIKRRARGTVGNVALTSEGSTISTEGMQGGLDPTIINPNLPRATYYREELAKRPVNIRNIKMTTGSTIIGNYRNNYEVVSTVGAFANPRSFIENQPTLPTRITSQTNLNRGGEDRYTGQTGQTVLNYLTLNRTSGSHFDFELDYGVTDNSGSFSNKSVIITRFGAPGSRDTMARGYQDFKSSEFSVYNTTTYRNLSVLDAGQSNETSAQTGLSGYIVSDIHHRPFGLKQHLTRHAARFGRDSMAVTGISFATNGPGASYDQLPAFQKTHRNVHRRLEEISDGSIVTGSVYDNWYVQHAIPRSDQQYMWITSSLVSNNDHFGYLPADYLVSNSSGYAQPYTFISTYDTNAAGAVIGLSSSLSMQDPSNPNGVKAAVFGYNSAETETLGFRAYFRPVSVVGLNDVIYEAHSNNILGSIGSGSLAYGASKTPPLMSDFINNYTVWGDFNYDLGSNGTIYKSSGSLCTWQRFQGDAQGIGYFPDSSGNNRTGSIAGAWPNADASNKPSQLIQTASLAFDDATGNRLNLGTGSLWGGLIGRPESGGTGKWTIAFWMRRTNNNPGYIFSVGQTDGNCFGGSGFGCIKTYGGMGLSMGTGGNYLNFYTYSEGIADTPTLYQFGPTSADGILNQRRRGPSDWLEVPAIGSNQENLWNHVVLSYDTVNNFQKGPQLYLNGESWDWTAITNKPSSTSTWGGIFEYSTTSGVGQRRSDFWIGGNNSGSSTSDYFDGNLADFAVWNSVLTPTEVRFLYKESGYTYGSSSAPTDQSTPRSKPYPANVKSAYSGRLLNSVLLNRNGPYGWPTWKQIDYNNPVIRDEHAKNQISVYSPGTGDNNTDFKTFDLSPVSMRGRTAKINFDSSPNQDVTLEVTHNNLHIYFKDAELNDITNINYAEIATPLDQLIDITKTKSQYSPNWILYSQNIFPSERNEFESYATQRTGYDSGFWRNSLVERIGLGKGQDNSFGIPLSNGALRYSFQQMQLTQSVWPLDPPFNFLTRATAEADPPDNLVNYYRFTGSGELQNTYVIAPQKPAYFDDTRFGAYGSPGALYSRKQTLTSPVSVVSPSGIAISGTGSYSASMDRHEIIGVFGGEAVWDAPAYAGINIKSGSTFTFQSHSSEPWFSDYDEFKQDLKLKAKDYSIVPEFRISEHVADFRKYGLFDKNNTDIFEIPGTGINSANTDSFYRDYSNSEFLKGFLNIKEESLLNATEISLECKAAIRLNPYKGFYPVQRTTDLVSQWSSSYASGLMMQVPPPIARADGAATTASYGLDLLRNYGPGVRPVIAPLFAPGILYNSIKSGMAVDYPVLTDSRKALKWPFQMTGSQAGWNTGGFGGKMQNWLLTINPNGMKRSASDPTGYDGKTFWDKRIPFEAIIKPEEYLSNLQLLDMESHWSASLLVTSSLVAPPKDELYTLMASNYFGEIGKFFLQDSNYTKLESRPIADKLTFEAGSTYAARIKLRRSTKGPRSYEFELDSNGRTFVDSSTGSYYRQFGGAGPPLLDLEVENRPYPSGAYFPLPQDPRFTPGFQETFTLYSRPTAFGPPAAALRITGSTPGSPASTNTVRNVLCRNEERAYRPQDSLNGYNWGFTPPYYYGEAWADLIFRPESGKEYSVEQILSECSASYWRFDAGGHWEHPTLGTEIKATYLTFTGSFSGSYTGPVAGIYNADNINNNCMQLSASINLLGVERVQFTERDKFDNVASTRNTTTATKWVISPKFETPHLNFNKAIGQATMPTACSSSVAAGMWHQFGKIPTDPNTGIFLEIDDIDEQWQKYHYDMGLYPSIYNDFSANQEFSDRKFKSLSALFGFKDENKSRRLGELADSQVLREAIVAIPYTTEQIPGLYNPSEVNSERTQLKKKFISIPKERFRAALKDTEGSIEGDSLEAAGESIRKLVQKMERYVLPPQFDFLSNRNIDPIAMYVFEFEYKLDRDDLSYIWQNLAPRDHKKLTFQKSSIAHELLDTELLSQDNIMDSSDLRWMVFKVKQRSQTLYQDLVPAQAGQADRDRFIDTTDAQNSPYTIGYNWPYDYVSFVEMVKMDAKVLYGGRGNNKAGERLPLNYENESPLASKPNWRGMGPTVPNSPKALRSGNRRVPTRIQKKTTSPTKTLSSKAPTFRDLTGVKKGTPTVSAQTKTKRSSTGPATNKGAPGIMTRGKGKGGKGY